MRLTLTLLMVCAICACSRESPNVAAEGVASAASDRGDERHAAPQNASPGVSTGAEISTAPAEANRLEALRAETLPIGFAMVAGPRRFEFPRDHGPHPQFRHEWWYVTGHLDSETGEPFGFELTFFRFALKPPAEPAVDSTQPADVQPVDAASAWRTRQIYMAHFAVSDIARREFHVSERFARDALGLAGAQADPFRVSLDDWSLGAMSSAPTNALSGVLAAAPTIASEWRLVAADKGYSLDLKLNADSPITLNGDAGLSRKADSEGAASYYYSMPRMAAQGRLVRDGKPLNVRGTVWLDREWGSGGLGTDQQGWDWFALQLDDGSALMFYALRKRNGERDAHSAGTWLAPDGSVRPLKSDEVLIDVKDEWTSPRGGRYPARWQLRVPSLQLDVDIQPRLADQELDTSTRYWEGASSVTGTSGGRAISGKAYVELVGYATR